MFPHRILFKQVWILLATIYFLITFVWCGNNNLKDLGEKQYYRIKAKSTMPYHGACWHNALKAVKSSCDKLDDNEHILLSLLLTNCFLEDSGHAIYDCHTINDSTERRKCINEMPDRAFGVYNEFYIYASHICFFLNHEIWQEETQKTIKHLYDASSTMKNQLELASQMQGAMLESQKEGLKIQNQLLDNGKELENVIQSSSQTVLNMIYNFKESVKDQKELLFQIFAYVRSFQNWIISEVSWFQSILYYTFSCILSALCTATKKTANARIILFTTQSINIAIERMLVQYYSNISDSISDDKIYLMYYIWCIRKSALLICILSLLYTYYNHKDEYLVNQILLQRIENHLNSLENVSPIKEITSVRYSKRLALKKVKHLCEQSGG